MSTSNCIMKIITEIAILNPMCCSRNNYTELLDGQGTLNFEPCIWSWNFFEQFKNNIFTLNELIDIRDGIEECNGFTKDEISRFTLNICTH